MRDRAAQDQQEQRQALWRVRRPETAGRGVFHTTCDGSNRHGGAGTAGVSATEVAGRMGLRRAWQGVTRSGVC